MKNKKLIFIFYPWETIGGAIIRTVNIIKVLNKYFDEIDLLIVPPINSQVLISLSETLNENFHRGSGVYIYIVDSVRMRKTFHGIHLDFTIFIKSLISILKHISSIKHKHYGHLILYARPPLSLMLASVATAKIYNGSAISEIHHTHADSKSKVYNYFIKTIELILARLSDIIVINSVTFYSKVYECWKTSLSKVVIVKNCIDLKGLQREKKGINNRSEDLIGFVGSLKPEEDLTTLFKAFKIVLRKRKNLSLIIIGGGSIEYYKKLAEKMKIDKHIVFLGERNHKETLNIMKRMKVFVVPRIKSKRTETVAPMKIIEALALGIPVVATDLPAIRELVNDAAILVPPNDHAALALAILRLLEDSSLQKELISKGRKYIKNYDCNVTVTPLIFRLKQLCAH